MESSNIILSKPAQPSPSVLVVEAPSGNGRRHWIERHLQQAAESGTRVFDLSCHFDAGGPWAGVNTLFSRLLPEIQGQCPDLVQRHSLELVYILPQLRRQLLRLRGEPLCKDLATKAGIFRESALEGKGDLKVLLEGQFPRKYYDKGKRSRGTEGVYLVTVKGEADRAYIAVGASVVTA